MFAVFQKAWRDSRRTLLWTGIGLGLYVLFCLSFYPTMLEQEDQMNDLLKSYPPEMLAMLYGEGAENFNIADPIVFLQTYIGTWAVLIMAGILIAQAFNAVTNEERSGAMDIMMSLPVSRRDMLLGRILNTGLGILLILASLLAIVLAATATIEGFDISFGNALVAIYGAFFPLMIVAMVSYLLAVFIPSRRKFAGALAYLFLMGSYLLNGFAISVENLSAIRPFLIFNYYSMTDLVNNGVNWGEWGILSLLIVLGIALALWGMDRKELAV